MAILLENASLVTLNASKPILEAQQILIHEGTIAQVGRKIHTRGLPITRRIDCSEMIVMPGLVNAHSHLTEILQKSFRDNVRMEIWRGYRATTEDLAHLKAEEIGTAAELACSEMLKNGVTAVVDHFSTRPGLSVGKMEAILGAFEKTGIRGMLVPSLRDQDFIRLATQQNGKKAAQKASPEPWKEEVLTVLARLRRSPTPSGIMLGPSSPMNCSDELLREVVKVAEQFDLGIHTHLLETRLQAWAAHKIYKKTLCAHLADIGFLSPRVSTAHSIWLDEREMDLLASSGASVVHNPASNLKLGSGVAPVAKLKARGVNVALGTDGGDTSDSYSIFEQMRLAAFLSRIAAEDPETWITALDALRMGTVNGAQAIPAWRGKIGKIKPGYRADLLLLKPSLQLRPLRDIVHQLVFCEGGQSVDTVLVDGKVVLEGGRLTNVDEDALIRRVEPISKTMYRLYGRIKNKPDRSHRTIRELYKKSFAAKGLPLRFVP
ncbi:MAG TPA: amidohydrolase [Candidatus Binatia bacterium]|jgi:cytosine/adenosine deaminase-related metal-dependent hydrolase|nr:amidohydrolase [Candidatus Binatia bacterium]